jgi:hypothetical protein
LSESKRRRKDEKKVRDRESKGETHRKNDRDGRERDNKLIFGP